jgi:beta-phosphoglucomutase
VLNVLGYHDDSAREGTAVGNHFTLKSIIFDFDGVLADTESLHLRGFQIVLSAVGIHLSAEDYARKYVGLTDAECFRAVSLTHRQAFTSSEVDRLIRQKSAWMLEAMECSSVILSGTADVVRSLAGQYRLAVASCALREEIERSLQVAGLIDAFEVIAAAEDVRSGKPDPSIYLYALDKLNENDPLDGASCLAIEDTPVGIRAAQGAGMKCLAVATTLPAPRLAAADAVVPSLARCNFPDIARRLWS